MNFKRGLMQVADLDVNETLASAKSAGVLAYILPSTGITNRESFFDAVRASLPLDPALVGTRSWDALSDSLWGGLDALDVSRVAIIWPNSSTMRCGSAPDHELALNVLADIAASLADASATSGNPKEVSIILG